jgi:anaerobic dimethyl sulfoxide reductase subunit A
MHVIKQIPFSCSYDCGCRCELIAHVKNNEIIRIDTPANRPDSITQPRLIPCVKGRARRRSVIAPERVKTPLKRTGPRGSGTFEEVTWESALDEITLRLEKIKDEYGFEAVFHANGSGSIMGRGFNGSSASSRFFSFWGSVTQRTGSISFHCVQVASQWMLGEVWLGSDRSTLLDSQLIILWGNNPAETRLGPNTNYFIAEARDRGARVILIDPRFTDSGILADEWVPIKPGTDAALIASMAYVMETNNLVDTGFIEKYTHGYNEYVKYVLGEIDGVEKTPSWAEQITGISDDKIIHLAQEYAQAKPASILAGWGPQRSEYGEQTARAFITLACMGGNVGISGGGLAGIGTRINRMPIGSLPYGPFDTIGRVNSATWASTILEGGLDPPIKMAYIVASNFINRCPDTLKNIKALEQMDFIVCQDPYLTPTALYSDIVLPICTDLERSDLLASFPHDSHLFYGHQLIEKYGKSRTDYWVFSELAKRLGFYEEYTHGRSEEEWIDHFLASTELDVTNLKREGILRVDEKQHVALEKFRADPKKSPLNTSTGLIEIINPDAEKSGLPAIPSYIGVKEESIKYPFQLITPHCRIRSHSILYSNPWLKRLDPHSIWINRKDAEVKGIQNGDLVDVWSRSGRTRLQAMVTERIIPGVVSIYQGTWYIPGEDGVDEGGCANVVTSHRSSKTGGFATHTDFVNVVRYSK